MTCQGHFLFDESYFTKHHKAIFSNRFPKQYIKNLKENQIKNPIVKKEYLESKMIVKEFCKYYLLKRHKISDDILFDFDNIEKGIEFIKKCKKSSKTS